MVRNIASLLTIAILVFLEISLCLLGMIGSAYIPVFGLLIVISFVVFCVRLHWALYVLIFLVPLNTGFFIFKNDLASQYLLATNCSIPLFIPILLIIFLAWFVRISCGIEDKKRYVLPINKTISMLMILFVAWNATTLFWAPNLFLGFVQLVKLVANICIFYLFYCCISDVGLLKRIGWAWIVLGLVLFVLSFFSIYGTSLTEQIEHTRFLKYWEYEFEFNKVVEFSSMWKAHPMRGTAMTSYNALPFILNGIIGFGLGLLLSASKEDGRQRSVLMAILFLLVCSHLTSQSKGGLIGLFAMVFFFLVVVSRLRVKFIRNSVVFVVGLVFFNLFIHIENTLMGRFRFISSTAAFSAPTRLAWWSDMIGLFFRDTMGLGLGIGGAKFYLDPVPNLHSIYFSILCDMGFVGVMLVFFMVAILVKEAMSVIKHQETFVQYMMLGGCGAMVAVGVHGLVDFHYNHQVIWMFLGMGMAVLRLAKQELTEEHTGPIQPTRQT